MLATNLKNDRDFDLDSQSESSNENTGLKGKHSVPGYNILASNQDIEDLELNASGVRKILQAIFPLRRLVLSQFTLYNQLGITVPTGKTFSRGRRCYKVKDLLAVSLILALKEQGIPNKNLENLAPLIQSEVNNIFSLGKGSMVSGFDNVISLRLLGSGTEDEALNQMLLFDNLSLNSSSKKATSAPMYWAYDVGYLSEDLIKVTKVIYSTLIDQDVDLRESNNSNINRQAPTNLKLIK